MSTRPEILFPLFANIKTLPGVGPKIAASLESFKITRPRDLVFHLPYDIIDRRAVATVIDAPGPKILTVEVQIIQHFPPNIRGKPYRVVVKDSQTNINLIFFHARGDYVTKLLPVGERRLISGKVEFFDGSVQMTHPDYVLPLGQKSQLPNFEPIYPLTAGVTGKMMTKAVTAAIVNVPFLPEWIEPSLLNEKGWPSFSDALIQSHRPESTIEISARAPARERLAYDEFLAHQLTKAIARKKARIKPGRVSKGDGNLQQRVLECLPYKPTGAQTRCIGEIGSDMSNPQRMNRLLQGDVGAGKTLVGFMGLLQAVESGGQGVMMAPTEILARQHLDSLRPLAEHAGVTIDILTGRDRGSERIQKLKKLVSGELNILVGTHAVFQEDVKFFDLRLSIIDEQHRFGVNQRLALGDKGTKVDVLVMTATPIPRSLELAQYGDMDVSVLDEKPPGRKPIVTAAMPVGRIADVVAKIKLAINDGRQVYWVCPLVEESEFIDRTAAEDRFKYLRAALGDQNVGLIHGQMASNEKDKAMASFVAGSTMVLVATTVIEVGVDVPNATIMVIEGAESFGLSQLHQLRGRVGRGLAVSNCLLIYQPPLSNTGERRLSILRETEDGFKIAEEDLKMRGAGDIIGTAQSGLPQFKVADLESQGELMELAHQDARMLLQSDPELTGKRGCAAKNLLWLMDKDKSIGLISVG